MSHGRSDQKKKRKTNRRKARTLAERHRLGLSATARAKARKASK